MIGDRGTDRIGDQGTISIGVDTLPDLEEIGARVERRLDEGDVIPALLFRERPHLAHLAPLAEAAIREEQRIRRRSQPRP